MFWSSKHLGGLKLKLTMITEEPGTSGEQVAAGGEQSVVSGSKLFVHPDKFYGYPNDDVIDWFSSFERIARANEWPVEKCRRMISAYLRGPAGDHFEKIDEQNKCNYKTIKTSLIERFSPAVMRRSAYSTLAGRKQGKHELVNEFASVIQRLVFRSFASDVDCEVVEMTAREHFILGLKPTLMRRVTMADPKTFNDAIRVALREESLEITCGPEQVHAVQSSQQNSQMTEVIGLLTKLLQKSDTSGINNSRSKNSKSTKNRFSREGRPICNFCNKPGRIERSCWVKYPDLKTGAKVKSRSEN